jgi:hypothetical protein
MSKKAKIEKLGRLIIYIVSTAYFIALSTVFPLFITRTHYLTITQDKANFFLTITTIAAAIVAAVWFFIIYRSKNEPKRPLAIYEWAIITFISLAFLSAIFSPHSGIVWRGQATGRWEGFWVILCYVLAFFLIARFYKSRPWHLWIFAAGSSLLSLYGILQFTGIDPLIEWGYFINLPPEGTPQAAQVFAPLTRLFRVTLGNINIVAAYAGFASVLFAMLFAGERKLYGIIYLIPSLLAFSMLWIAGSRGTGNDGAILGIIAATTLSIPFIISDRHRLGKILILLAGWAAVYAIFNNYLAALQQSLPPRDYEGIVFWADYWLLYTFTPQNSAMFWRVVAILVPLGLTIILIPLKKWPVKILKITGMVLIPLLIVGALVFINTEGARREGSPGDIIWQARELIHGRPETFFGSNRIFVWQEAVSVLTDRPLLGSGPATFHLALSEEFQAESRGQFGVIFDTAHNIYLQTAITLGIPALLALLTFLATLFFPAIKAAFNYPILLAFGIAALGYLIQGFFQVDTPIDRPLLWLALGVVASEIWRNKLSSSNKPCNSGKKSKNAVLNPYVKNKQK